MTRLKVVVYVSVLSAFIFAAFLPNKVSAKTADTGKCSAVGYTIAFVNGIFDSREQAQANATALQLALDSSYKGEPIHVQLAYNAEHIGGAGDLVETVSQMLFNPVSDYDLHDLLKQLAGIDTTQKLLITGFSQGALYGNSIYEYLVAAGRPANSVGVYAVATPTNHVAGGGRYITSNEDAVIFVARVIAEKIKAPVPLPGNIHIKGSLAIADLPKTHAFISYITGARKRVESDIYKGLGELQEWKSAPKKAGCIALPEQSLADAAQQGLFAIVDPAAAQFKTTIVSVYQGVIAIAFNAFKLAQSGYAAVSSIFGGRVATANTNPVIPENQKKDFAFVKKLYGSSLDQETYEELNPQQEEVEVVTDEPHVAVVTTISTSSVATSQASAQIIPPPYVYTGGTGLPPPEIKHMENTTTTSPPTIQEDPIATSTDNSTETVVTTAPTSTPQVATTSSQTPPVFTPEHSPISDTFNAFNSKGWQSFGQNVKNFDFNDGEDGECLRNGCAVGMGGNVYDTLVPRMYIQTGEGLGSGAYTLYVKARAGFNNPIPAITICAAGYASCTDNGSAKGLNFIGLIPLDNTWHHYYFAWKQGDSFVQSCFMQDYHHFSDCVWVDTDFAAGTTFDGIALWSTNGWRADVAPNANLWFDELDAK